jgi:hypothetical protein
LLLPRPCASAPSPTGAVVAAGVKDASSPELKPPGSAPACCCCCRLPFRGFCKAARSVRHPRPNGLGNSGEDGRVQGELLLLIYTATIERYIPQWDLNCHLLHLLLALVQFHQYHQVVGRALPTPTEEQPKIYRMKLIYASKNLVFPFCTSPDVVQIIYASNNLVFLQIVPHTVHNLGVSSSFLIFFSYQWL